MKKFFILLLSLTMIVTLSFSVVSKDLSESIEVYRNRVKLEVNGNAVGVDNFLYQGSTYIPLRAVSELLDKYVGWNTLTNTASINDSEYKIQELSKLLANSKGFKWNYNGFAEYGHIMKLEDIVDEDNKREYIINGEVGDPSGGESDIDRSLHIKYTIKDNKLIQEKTEKSMMDSKFDKLTLIQAPLVAGTY
jgi:copper amine oxidase-like protein